MPLRSAACTLLVVLSAAVVSAAGLSGCGGRSRQPRLQDLNELHPKIGISQIPAVKLKGADLKISYKPRVSLAPIVDERLSPTVIVFQGKEIAARGEITLLVDYVLKKALRQRGIALDKDAPLILRTIITRWRAEPGEAEISAEAVVRAELLGPGGENVYTGLYEGFSKQESPQLFVRDVKLAMGKAMHQALSSLMKDERMLEFLSAY